MIMMMMKSLHRHAVYALYITLTARKLSKLDDGRYRLKHVVLY